MEAYTKHFLFLSVAIFFLINAENFVQSYEAFDDIEIYIERVFFIVPHCTICYVLIANMLSPLHCWRWTFLTSYSLCTNVRLLKYKIAITNWPILCYQQSWEQEWPTISNIVLFSPWNFVTLIVFLPCHGAILTCTSVHLYCEVYLMMLLTDCKLMCCTGTLY